MSSRITLRVVIAVVVALLFFTAGQQVSLVSAQDDAEGLNVTDTPKILFTTAGFLNIVPEQGEWEAFQVGMLGALCLLYSSMFLFIYRTTW